MKYRQKIVSLMGLACLLAGIYSCKSDLAFSGAESLPSKGWFFKDTLSFSPALEKQGATYDIRLWVRHTKQYNYSNIWVRVISEAGLTADSTGLVEIPLADKTGRWLGQCSQSYCTAEVTLAKGINLGDPGAFRIDVVQYMREETLQGIREVGVEIEAMP